MAPKYHKSKSNKCQRAASLVEYSLLLALIAIISIGAVKTVGSNIKDSFTKTAVQISAAGDIDACTPSSPTYPGCLFLP